MSVQPATAPLAFSVRFDSEVAALDDTALEHDLCVLAGNLNAASYRFCRLIAECDRRELWASQGAVSCAAWLSWVCGLSLHAAREKIRVGHALDDLPLISAAFAAGEISFSKVRAMTRVAVPENEDYLLSIARHGTASHMETLVSAYRRSLMAAEAHRAEAQHAARRLHWWVDEEGMMVIKCRLPGEAGVRVIKAVEAAIDEAEAEYRGDGTLASDNPKSEHFDFTPAAEQGLSPSSYALSSGHGLPVVDVVAMKRADALVRLADGYLDGESSPKRAASERYQVTVHIDAKALAHPERPGRADLEVKHALAAESVRRLSCDTSVIPLVEKLNRTGAAQLDIGRKTRSIPPAIKRALYARDQGCCFPGCSATRHVEGHHIHHWANGGKTSLDNLISLCGHHHRLVHEGGYTVERTITGEHRFLRPNGGRVPAEPPRLFVNGTLADENRVREIPIDHRTARPRWDGLPMDRCYAVELLHQRTNGRTPTAPVREARQRIVSSAACPRGQPFTVVPCPD